MNRSFDLETAPQNAHEAAGPISVHSLRAQRIAAIKEAIDAGRYPLHSDRIAAAMIEEAELMEARRLRPTRT